VGAGRTAATDQRVCNGSGSGSFQLELEKGQGDQEWNFEPVLPVS